MNTRIPYTFEYNDHTTMRKQNRTRRNKTKQDIPETVSTVSTKVPTGRTLSVRTLDESLHNNNKIKELASIRRKIRLESSTSSGAGQGGGSNNLGVRFDKVLIRDYPIEIGDNPAVSSGAPLTIGWKHFAEDEMEVDAYESIRDEDRREYTELIIPPPARKTLLTRLGYTNSEIERQSRDAKALRIKRLETSQFLYKSESEEKMEKLSRGLKNIISNKKKRRERKMIQQSMELGKSQLEHAHKQAEIENRNLEDLKNSFMDSSLDTDSESYSGDALGEDEDEKKEIICFSIISDLLEKIGIQRNTQSKIVTAVPSQY